MRNATVAEMYREERAKAYPWGRTTAIDAIRQARYRARWAGSRLPAGGTVYRGDVVELAGPRGWTVRYEILEDEQPADLRDGKVTERWEAGALDVSRRYRGYLVDWGYYPDSRPVYFVPSYDYTGDFEHHRRRLGKAAAREAVRALPLLDAARYFGEGIDWYYVGLRVTVYRHGIELGCDSLWGFQSDSDPAEFYSTFQQLRAEAFATARRTLEKLQGDAKRDRVAKAAPALLEAAREADTLTQNVAELLTEYADGDAWAADLLEQVNALGGNARAAIAAAEGGPDA